ncbi:MAG TPA: MFS transporter, partial [Gallionellaceae bacterium]|nr:MFS transporter [Gallionellaceae bacterium]
MNRNVLILSFCQAMLFTGIGLVVASSALIGQQLAPSPAWATLPLALQYLTTMLVAYYFSSLMKRKGRRYVFVRGALLGMVGAGVACLGIWQGNFYLFAGASLLIGMHTAIAQFYRFAAAEAVPADLKARAISLTLAGGVVAAFIGPNLARYTRDLLEPIFLASFLMLVLATAAAAWLSSRLDLPALPADEHHETGRPLLQIAMQDKYLVALLAAMVGYGVMNFLMVSTPLAMHSYGCSFPSTTWVIQWHLVAMFAPSFFTGDVIRKVGVVPVMLAGCLLIGACALINLSGTTVSHFETALILLGVGWNFLYIGGTTLLTETYTPQEKSRAQGLNDTLVFATLTFT